MKLPTKDIEGLSYLFGGMPFRAVPVALTPEGDPILITVNRKGMPELTVKWMHDGSWNYILNANPKAYLAGEPCPSRRQSGAASLKDITSHPVRQLVEEFIYRTSMLDDQLAGPGPSQSERRNAMAARIRDSAEIEHAFIACGEDLKYKSVWLAIAERYRTMGSISGFMVALQNALGACTIHPDWGCRASDGREKWDKCLDYMRTGSDFVSSRGDALDVATYEAMMEAISKDS